ncbi:MAG TPA: gluconokinase [Pyrinomonadaceae bacterium]|nr:gluconokinase [Pyrinomonadaceae bacterium]
MRLIIMGVSGSGKTTVGRRLSEALGYEFVDADDLHSPENIRKMTAGEPLTDEDRMPWLLKLREVIRARENIVMACSALKKSYRDVLADQNDPQFIYLRGTREMIEQRLSARPGHFMKASMLDSQFDILEEPDNALALDIATSPDDLVGRIRRCLGI